MGIRGRIAALVTACAATVALGTAVAPAANAHSTGSWSVGVNATEPTLGAGRINCYATSHYTGYGEAHYKVETVCQYLINASGVYQWVDAPRSSSLQTLDRNFGHWSMGSWEGRFRTRARILTYPGDGTVYRGKWVQSSAVTIDHDPWGCAGCGGGGAWGDSATYGFGGYGGGGDWGGGA